MQKEQPYIGFVEKKEWIVDSYKSLYDKDLAYIRCGVTEEERKILDADVSFQDRLQFTRIQKVSELVNQLDEFRNMIKPDATALKALMLLGQMVCPEKFIIKEPTKEDKPLEVDVNLNIIKTITQDDYSAEVLGILAASGVLQPKTEDAANPEIN
jgi:hypothetical protein